MSTAAVPVPLIVYTGLVYRTLPRDDVPSIDELLSDGDGERFSDGTLPTVYLATDEGVAIAEMARHLDVGADEPRDTTPHLIVRMRSRVEGVADIRDPFTLRALGLEGGVFDLLDRHVARGLATRLRGIEGCQGLLAPSMALPDEPERGNLVLFAERLPGGLESVLWPPRRAGRIEFVPRPPESY